MLATPRGTPSSRPAIQSPQNTIMKTKMLLLKLENEENRLKLNYLAIHNLGLYKILPSCEISRPTTQTMAQHFIYNIVITITLCCDGGVRSPSFKSGGDSSHRHILALCKILVAT